MPAVSASATVPPRVRVLCVLFFFSGFPALIYQLTWQRSLFRIFGVNTESVTIVVTAFMLGLGLGSLVGGWISKRRNVRPLLLLGLIELLTAAFGVVSLAIFDQVGQSVSDLPLVVVAVINLLLVLIPTLLMGATLPILVSHLVQTSGRIGTAVGTLYFVNTLGAGAACLVCAAMIFPFMGMHAAIWIGAGINVVVGIGAFFVHYVNRDWTETSASVAAKPTTTPPLLGMPFVILLASLGGFVSLSYEIFLFRTISYASGSSSLAFALTLCGFLVGIAGGARVAAAACDRLPPVDAMRKAATDLIWGNLFGALFLPLMTHFAWTGSGVIGLAVAMIYLIARQWGALLPYLSQFGISVNSGAGMQTALLYSANIAGCAAGAVLTGFFLTNWLGLVPMAVFLLAGGTLCAVLLIAALPATVSERARRGSVALAVLLAGAVAIPVAAQRLFEKLQNRGGSDHDFAHIVENRSGIITVDTDGTVFGNGMYDGRFNTDLKTDSNGIIRPYALSLFHAAPRDVLMIGLSSGSWAQVIASNPAVASLTVIEINPGYLELIEQQPEVRSILRNPKVRIIQDDGRRWLGRHPEMHFDAIVANTTFHFRANTTNLLSSEYLALVKQHLALGGVYFYNTTGSRRAQKTACTAFPHGARFLTQMVVSETRIDWDFTRWREVLENYKIDGKPEFDPKNAVDRSRIDSLLNEYRRGGPMIEECPELLSATTDSAVITDDNMGTEWRYFLRLD